jgi:hypothetical protein
MAGAGGTPPTIRHARAGNRAESHSASEIPARLDATGCRCCQAADMRAATRPPDWWGSRRDAGDTPTRGFGTIRFVRSSVVAAVAASWRRVRRDSLYPYAPGRAGAVYRHGCKALPEGAA